MAEKETATPDMVQQLQQLREHEMSAEEVRALQAQNQTATPTVASPDGGAQGNQPGSPAEPQPAEAQTPQAAPEPAPAPAPAPEESEEEIGEAEERLNAFLEEQLEKKVQEAQRTWQSTFDKRASAFDRQMQEARQREQDLTTQIRELQTQGLTEEQRAQVMAKWTQDDRQTELDAYRQQLLDAERTVFMSSLLLDYRQFGLTEEALEALESPEEMELFAEQQRAAYYEAQVKQQAEAQSAPKTPAPASPAPASAPNAPGVPAGASAPADVGSTAPTTPSKTPGEAPSMVEALRSTKWENVRI